MRLFPLSTVVWLFVCGFFGVSIASYGSSIIVSVPDQRLAVVENGQTVAQYAVSTSKFGLSDRAGSYGTPLGEMQIAQKIGASAPLGAVFKGRRLTGEVLRPNARGRDPIVTRILWLRGLESRNSHAYERAIYIHGTAEERTIGRPASYGCIRMRSRDVARLYDAVGVGAHVSVVNRPLGSAIRQQAVLASPASHQMRDQLAATRVRPRLIASLPAY